MVNWTAKLVRAMVGSAPAAAALLLSGCSVEFQNPQAAQALAQQIKPAGSAYTGWRLYQDKCLSCHGPAATGSGNAPNLLPLVREMGPRRFVGLVLQRYDWNLPGTQAARSGAALDALVDDIMQRKDGAATVMPAWENEPRVKAHILDLYAYLSARAEGTVGTGRPTP